MKNCHKALGYVLLSIAILPCTANAAALKVVTTLPDYATIARAIGGDHIDVQAIVKGEQDAHFIRPKPSFVDMVRQADVLVDTGLDLEMWLPTVVDKAGNNKVRSGQDGYVSAASGMHMLEKPKLMSRSEGGLHIYGNPHVTCSPINMRVAARNIATGLIKNDPSHKEYYENNLKAFINKLDEHLYGQRLVKVLGGDILSTLAEQRKLIPFLENQNFEGKPLIGEIGGWMKQMLPLRNTPIVTYHKNWVYFVTLFGLEEAGTVEPKPGIPPSPKHVLELTNMMKKREVKLILAANYFDERKIRTVAEKVNAKAVIVPLYVGGEKGVPDYFELVNLWVKSLLDAARDEGIIE